MDSPSQTTPSKHKEITVSAGAANLFGLLFLIPISALLAAPYIYLWPEQFTLERFKAYFQMRDELTAEEIFFGFLIIIGGIIVHELLHGLGWIFFTKKGAGSISFGIIWRYLTPYCHCDEALKLSAYRFGSALPAIILGIVPSLVAMWTGNLLLMVFGFFFTFAAGGDFLILWLLRKEKGNMRVLDHPQKIGCIILKDD